MRIVPSIENENRRKPGSIARRRKRDTVKYRVILYSLRSQTGRAYRMLQPQELVVARLLPVSTPAVAGHFGLRDPLRLSMSASTMIFARFLNLVFGCHPRTRFAFRASPRRL